MYWGGLWSAFTGFFGGLFSAVSSASSSIASRISSAGNAIGGIARSVGSVISNVVSTVGSAISSAARSVYSVISNVTRTVGSAFTSAIRGVGSFLGSPGGHQFLSQTSELSSAASTVSAIAALENPPIFPEAGTAALVFKGISTTAKAIDIEFQSSPEGMPRDIVRETINIYVGSEIKNPSVSPFVEKSIDVLDDYQRSREELQ